MSQLLGAAWSKDKPVSLALPPRHSSVLNVLSPWVPITLPFILWVLLSMKGAHSPQAQGRACAAGRTSSPTGIPFVGAGNIF